MPAGERTAYALWTDLREGKMPMASGFVGLKHDRTFVSYDIDSNVLSSGTILSLGNNPLPLYARAILKPNQNILTTKNSSVRDTDDSHVFQTPYFSYPTGRVSDVAVIILKDDLAHGAHNAYVYN